MGSFGFLWRWLSGYMFSRFRGYVDKCSSGFLVVGEGLDQGSLFYLSIYYFFCGVDNSFFLVVLGELTLPCVRWTVDKCFWFSSLSPLFITAVIFFSFFCSLSLSFFVAVTPLFSLIFPSFWILYVSLPLCPRYLTFFISSSSPFPF